jgi:hypothetical protein
VATLDRWQRGAAGIATVTVTCVVGFTDLTSTVGAKRLSATATAIVDGVGR